MRNSIQPQQAAGAASLAAMFGALGFEPQPAPASLGTTLWQLSLASDGRERLEVLVNHDDENSLRVARMTGWEEDWSAELTGGTPIRSIAGLLYASMGGAL
jgi:hypothetical protein